jgi:hypothetical protein
MGRRRFDLDARIVIIFLVVSIPLVGVGAFLVVGLIRSSLRDAIEVSLEQRALETKLLLERYMADQIVHLRLLAVDPQVRTAVTTRARKPEELQKQKQGWAAPAGGAATLPITATPLAARLREMASVRPAVHLLQVIDAAGHVVASSTRAGRFDHSEAAWFRARMSGDTSGPHIGDVHRPPGSSISLLEIDYPIVEPDTGQWLGAVHALLDSGDLYGVLGPVRIGRTGRAVLVRGDDGLVVASDESKKVLADKFGGFELIQAAIAAGQQHWTIPEMRTKTPSGDTVTREARLVAYSAVEQVPQVSWIVVVEQELGEAMAPIASVSRYLWLHFFAAFGSLAALAAYISLGLNRPVIERALHLHEEHVPASMRRRRTDRDEGESEEAS